MLFDETSYFNDPELQEIIDRYERMAEEGTYGYMEADELTDVAEYYMMKGREEEADACIQLAVELHPEAPDPQIFLARKAMFNGELKEAERILVNIPDQDDREVIFARAEILIRQQKVDLADKALKEYADRHMEEQADFAYDSASIFCDYYKWDYVKKWLERLKVLQPRKKRTREAWCEYLVCAGEREAAIEAANELLDEDAFNTKMWKMLAEAQCAGDEYDDALESVDNALAVDDEDEAAWLLRANCLFRMNRIEEAHKEFQRYLKNNPTNVIALYLEGVCLTTLGQIEEAYEILLKAQEESDGYAPEQSGICLQLSYVQNKMHHPKEALLLLDEACRTAGPEAHIEKELLQGNIYLDNGDPELAHEYFVKALEKSENRNETICALAVILTESGDYINAVELLKHIYKTQQDGIAMASPYIAFCYKNMGQEEDYKRYYDIAMRENPEMTKLLFRKK